MDMKVEFTKHGLKHDYRGAQVSWTVGERGYLGTVVGVYRPEARPITMFRVRHFNGEDAPDVAACCVEVLERTYEAGA
jgi:hypothetical protein